ncbi:MAG: carbohydrate porin [Coleofasciculaceae cyanobacterium SM2_3_26]|nr:carbohydrate porin [Coleofasciculaceae cyanobacterium SM2_3_26]
MLTGLQAGTGSTAPRLSNDTRLGYEGDTDGEFILSDLNYRQLIGNRFAFVIGPRGVNAVNVFRGANRIESAGRGPLSAFAQRNPIINIGGSGGIGFDWQLNPRLSVQGVYSASLLGDTENGGIFGGEDGETATGIQLTAVPFDTLDVTFSYVNAYSPFGRLGTGIGDDQLTTLDAPLKTQAYGITVAWQPTSQFRLGGWGGYTHSVIPGRTGSVETFNWMAFANLSDIFITDDLLGVYVGQPPRISSSTLPVGQNIPDLLAGGLGEEGEQPGTTTHVELFYRFPIAENIVLTPGAIVLFEPGNTPDSDTIVIGALRMTFNF